jgi:D-xylose transport system substrate-binding protein
MSTRLGTNRHRIGRRTRCLGSTLLTFGLALGLVACQEKASDGGSGNADSQGAESEGAGSEGTRSQGATSQGAGSEGARSQGAVSQGAGSEAVSGRGGTAGSGGEQIVIGLSLDTLREERWQRDRDRFVARAEELGAKVLVQAANNDDAVQNAQAENLLTQGVDVLVVAPHNAKSAATIVEAAHKSGVPVIAYDRLINDCDLDLYVSFDNLRVGELQAEYAVAHAPSGNYVLIAGAPTDNNAHLYREGQLNILQPYIDRGEIYLVTDQFANDWQPVEGLKILENALTRNHNDITAVVAANDGLAGGAIQALAEQKLTGKVIVTGQDAELAACRRIVEGSQSMTVYKPIQALATRGAEVAILLAKKQPVPDAHRTLHNGYKDVPSLLITPIPVDKTNLMETVIQDGYQKLEDVYRDVPREQWPVP